MLDFTMYNADINFTASVGPIYDKDGREIPEGLARGVYRDDTGKLMSICGTRFEPVQHRDLLDPVLQTLHDNGYEIVERNAQRGNFYDLAGQRGAFLHTATVNDGAVMIADVVVGDFITPTGRGHYLDHGPDVMLRRFRVVNSHGGDLAASVRASYLRLVCMNGMTSPVHGVSLGGKHTKGFDVAALAAKIAVAGEMMMKDAELFGLYAKTSISRHQAELFLRKTLAKLPDTEEGEPAYNERLIAAIMSQFDQEAQTVWGLVQALTHWATHQSVRSNGNEPTVRLDRDGRVLRVLQGKEFRKLMEVAA